MFGSLGMPELLLLFMIVMLVFGARKLPEVGKGLGRGIQNFKEAMRGGGDPALRDGRDERDERDDES